MSGPVRSGNSYAQSGQALPCGDPVIPSPCSLHELKICSVQLKKIEGGRRNGEVIFGWLGIFQSPAQPDNLLKNGKVSWSAFTVNSLLSNIYECTKYFYWSYKSKSRI